jgi:hypothetical protein
MAGIERGPWATGIGSLPFEKPDALERSQELLSRFASEIPFLPELPRAFPDDATVRRPFASVLEPGDMSEARLRVSLEEAGALVEELPPGVARFVSWTLSSSERRVLKFQVAGPTALGNYVVDPTGRTLRSTPEGRALVLARVKKVIDGFCELVSNQRAAASAAETRPPATAIILLDEPGLDPDVGDTARAVEHARKQGAFVGIHDCGPEFRNGLAAKPDILSFDFSTFGPHVGESGDPLRDFCRGGGALAWGAISTGPTARRFDPSVTAGAIRTAARRLMGSIDGEKQLLSRSLVTPACGSALLEPRHAVSLHDRARVVAELLRLGR